MLPVSDVKATMESPGLGFERVGVLTESTYKDVSTVFVCPTRGMIHATVVDAWNKIAFPRNQRKSFMFCVGAEVGDAYNKLVETVLEHHDMGKFKYMLTLEDDNLPPADVFFRLAEAIESNGGFDAMSGLYFTKGAINDPMAYGDPETFTRTGVLDWKPLDVREAIEKKALIECNGIGMGCALWRMDMFRSLPKPWFVTIDDVCYETSGGILKSATMTQDLSFCERARWAGKRFGVDCRVKVGHLDIQTGVVY